VCVRVCVCAGIFRGHPLPHPRVALKLCNQSMKCEFGTALIVTGSASNQEASGNLYKADILN